MVKITKLQFSWNNFYTQCKLDIKLWCYFILWQQICRLYLIYILRHNIVEKTGFTEILLAMLNGLRFDSLWATCWIFVALVFFTLPSLLVTIHSAPAREGNILKYRRCLGGIFTIFTTIIYIGAIEYFREYKDMFNQFLFNWFYDDKAAILTTVYTQHHVISNGILLIIILLLYIKLSGYFFNKKAKNQAVVGHASRFFTSVAAGFSPRFFKKHILKPATTEIASNATGNIVIKQHSNIYKIFMTIILILFYIIGFRGSIGSRPVQLKDAGVTTDEFLNKAIVSPYSSLKYAIDDYSDLNQELQKDANLSTEDVRFAAQKFFDNNNRYSSLADYMKKSALGSSVKKPQHIFVIVGESLDAWNMQDEYKKLNLTPNLRQLVKDGAIYFKYFLPGADGTMEALNTIITGIPDANMHINYQKTSYSAYPTAIAQQFKQLGFKTQFFYGGYLSWQRVGDFAKTQGFDAVFGGAHMKAGQQTNEWGVDDKVLFDFIVANVVKTKQPTFNVIMTTSNHPPFSINLEKENFNREDVAKYTSKNIHELGHIWYSDKTIGAFIKNITTIDNSALFAITGDHYGRRHIDPHPSLFDTTAVPLIIYGANIKRNFTGSSIAGSHSDLAPTLIEMVAPKGFVYYAFGNSLLNKRAFNLGLGKDRVITKDFIAATDSNEIMFFANNTTIDASIAVQRSAQAPETNQLHKNTINALKTRHAQAMCIARYIIKKGVLLHD